MKLKSYDIKVALAVYLKTNNKEDKNGRLATFLNDHLEELEMMVEMANIEETYNYLENICKLYTESEVMKLDYLQVQSKNYLIDSVDSLPLTLFSDQDYRNAFAYVEYTTMSNSEIKDILVDVCRVEQERALILMYRSLVKHKLVNELMREVCEDIHRDYQELVAMKQLPNLKVQTNLDVLLMVMYDNSMKVESFEELKEETLKEKLHYITEIRE